jgi:hypothetical protein
MMNDIFKDFEFPSEKEINEATRRAKISMTTNAKLKTDAEYLARRQQGALKTAEAKRKVPVEDYVSIILEYWNNDKLRPLGLTKTIGDRYGVKQGVIEKIIMNSQNSMPAQEYNKLRSAYESKYDRSDLLKQMHESGARDNKTIGEKISQTKNTVSRADAIEIYEKTFSCAHGRTAKYYKQLAKEYSVSFNKIQSVANAHHPALTDRDVKADVRQHEIKYLGIYKFTSPQGEEYVFDNLYDVGAFVLKTEKGITADTQTQYSKGHQWFHGVEPNVLNIKKKRFWIGWEYINIVQ